MQVGSCQEIQTRALLIPLPESQGNWEETQEFLLSFEISLSADEQSFNLAQTVTSTGCVCLSIKTLKTKT